MFFEHSFIDISHNLVRDGWQDIGESRVESIFSATLLHTETLNNRRDYTQNTKSNGNGKAPVVIKRGGEVDKWKGLRSTPWKPALVVVNRKICNRKSFTRMRLILCIGYGWWNGKFFRMSVVVNVVVIHLTNDAKVHSGRSMWEWRLLILGRFLSHVRPRQCNSLCCACVMLMCQHSATKFNLSKFLYLTL